MNQKIVHIKYTSNMAACYDNDVNVGIHRSQVLVTTSLIAALDDDASTPL